MKWLQADLAVYTKDAAADPQTHKTIRQRLTHWKTDPDLASIREPNQLAKLTEADREAWRKLWSDVDSMHNQADGGKQKPCGTQPAPFSFNGQLTWRPCHAPFFSFATVVEFANLACLD